MQYITSSQNAQFKVWKQLALCQRARHNEQQTLLEGIHLIHTALERDFPIKRWIVNETAQSGDTIQQLIAQCSAPITYLPDRLFATLSDLVTSTGLIALIDLPRVSSVKRNGFILALEGVQDPGNVGTMLRTAVAAGVTQVWLDAQCADIWSPKVLRAGVGAHFLVNCVNHVDLLAALTAFKGTTVAMLVNRQSQSIYHIDLTGDTVLVMGNEGRGISNTIRQQIDIGLTIPMQKGIESLNVSTAAAICLYERYRQQSIQDLHI